MGPADLSEADCFAGLNILESEAYGLEVKFCRPLKAQGLYLMSPRHRMRSKHDSDIDSELTPDLVGHAQRVRVGSSVAVEICGQSSGEPRLVY